MNLTVLVVDTNIVVSALLRSGLTRELLFEPNLELYSPCYVSEELAEHEAEFLEKSALSSADYRKASKLVLDRIRQLRMEEYAEFMTNALAVAPDADDWPFFALAMRTNCALWSNDKRLKKQGVVRIYSIDEVHALLRESL